MKKNNKEFRWGIIGTGGIANAFVKDLEYLDGHRVSSVLSRSMVTANSFTSDLKGCNGYDDINSFLDNDYIDAVYIATPNTFHAIQTILALESGIPVLCEKPFAMNLEEVKSMVESSEANNTTLLEGMWTRYLPHIKRVKQILEEDAIGKIESIFAFHGQNLRHSDNPRLWTKELGGGALLDLGIYVVSFAHLILGNPKEIIATSVFTNEGIDSKTSMIFKYDSNVIANLSCSMFDTQPNRAIISGERGLIEIEPTFYAPTKISIVMNNGETTSITNDYKGHGLREQARELEWCVRNNLIESPKMKHSESISVMKSMDKIRSLIGLSF
tara:strand:+ start:1000 stop:1983 length:984 start_codon:yes stop_codon:yes gene_type:complete